MKALLTTFMALCLSVSSINFAQAAEEDESESGLAIPRMVSLRSSLINVRSGPGHFPMWSDPCAPCWHQLAHR